MAPPWPLGIPMIEAVLRYGYVGVFLALMIESIGVPFPGETILVLTAAGAARRPAPLDIGWVLVIAVLGTTLGNTIGYLLGRTQGIRVLDWLLARLPVNPRHRQRAEQAFARYGAWAVFFGRFLAGLRIFAGPLAGTLRLPWPVFLLANLGGAVLWVSTVGAIAYTFAAHLALVLKSLGQAGLILTAALVAALLALAAYWRMRRAKTRIEDRG